MDGGMQGCWYPRRGDQGDAGLWGPEDAGPQGRRQGRGCGGRGRWDRGAAALRDPPRQHPRPARPCHPTARRRHCTASPAAPPGGMAPAAPHHPQPPHSPVLAAGPAGPPPSPRDPLPVPGAVPGARSRCPEATPPPAPERSGATQRDRGSVWGRGRGRSGPSRGAPEPHGSRGPILPRSRRSGAARCGRTVPPSATGWERGGGSWGNKGGRGAGRDWD